MGLFSSTGNIRAQSSDPGAIGAGSIWSKTDSEETNRRNDANSAWVLMLPSSNVGADTIVNADVNTAADISLSKIGDDTTAGDFIKRDGTSWARLGIGSANQALLVNPGADDVAYTTQAGRFVVFAISKDASTVTAKVFFPFGSDQDTFGNTTASNVDIPISVTQALTLTRLIVKVVVNGQTTGTNPVTFVDDGSDAASVDTGTTAGEKDSGALSVSIAADSSCCFSYDAAASAKNVEFAVIAELEYDLV